MLEKKYDNQFDRRFLDYGIEGSIFRFLLVLFPSIRGTVLIH